MKDLTWPNKIDKIYRVFGIKLNVLGKLCKTARSTPYGWVSGLNTPAPRFRGVLEELHDYAMQIGETGRPPTPEEVFLDFDGRGTLYDALRTKNFKKILAVMEAINAIKLREYVQFAASQGISAIGDIKK